MTMFKQIIGRGTRIDEDNNKYFFTIMDFKKATELFRDPEFDGDPVVIFSPGPDDSPVPPDPPSPGDYGDDGDGDGEGDDGGFGGTSKIRVSDVDVSIIAERVEYLDHDGKLITESYKEYARKQITEECRSLDDFIQRWGASKRKQAIIEELEERGVILDNLAEAVGQEFGDFDLLCHVAYGQPPLTRKERAEGVRKRDYFTKYGAQARAVLEALLDKYADEGIAAIENAKVLRLKPFDGIGTPIEIINGAFGGKANYEQAIQELEHEIYTRMSNE